MTHKSHVMNSRVRPKKIDPNVHQGQNIKRIRLILGLSQKLVAAGLGNGWNQKKVSRIECRPQISFKLRQQLAQFLKVDIELFDSFDEAAGRMALNYIMKFGNDMPAHPLLEQQQIMEEIYELIMNTKGALHMGSENMQLIKNLIAQMNARSVQWADIEKPGHTGEAKERSPVWRVA